MGHPKPGTRLCLTMTKHCELHTIVGEALIAGGRAGQVVQPSITTHTREVCGTQT